MKELQMIESRGAHTLGSRSRGAKFAGRCGTYSREKYGTSQRDGSATGRITWHSTHVYYIKSYIKYKNDR